MNQGADIHNSIKDIARLIREAHRQMSGPEFVTEYRKLTDQMFLGDYAKTTEAIQAGNSSAIEFGLVFLEVRPYFFRSQYIRTQLIRLLKHTSLSLLQSERFKHVLEVEHDKKMKGPAAVVRKLLGDSRQKARHGKPHA